MADDVVQPGARELLRVGLDGRLDAETVRVLLEEILAVRKKAWGSCPGCRKMVEVEVADARAVASALGELLTQGGGRPGQAVEGDSGPRVVFTRKVVYEGASPEDAGVGASAS